MLQYNRFNLFSSMLVKVTAQEGIVVKKISTNHKKVKFSHTRYRALGFDAVGWAAGRASGL